MQSLNSVCFDQAIQEKGWILLSMFILGLLGGTPPPKISDSPKIVSDYYTILQLSLFF